MLSEVNFPQGAIELIEERGTHVQPVVDSGQCMQNHYNIVK